MEQKKFNWDIFFIQITSRPFMALLFALIGSAALLVKLDPSIEVQITTVIADALAFVGYCYTNYKKALINAETVTPTTEEEKTIGF